MKFVMVPGGWQGGWAFDSVVVERCRFICRMLRLDDPPVLGERLAQLDRPPLAAEHPQQVVRADPPGHH